MDSNVIARYPGLFFHDLNNIPFALIEWDSNLRIKTWSSQAEQIFGWKEAEIREKHYTEIPIIFKEDQPKAEELAQQLMAGKTNFLAGPYRSKTKDGQCIQCLWFSTVVKTRVGKIKAVLSLVYHVTESAVLEEEFRKAHERFSFISNATNDGIWEWDTLQNKVWVNETYIQTFGYNPQEYDDFYNEWLKRIHPDDKEHFLTSIYAAQGNREQQWSGEFRFLLANGTYGNILQRSYFIYDAAGVVKKVVGIDLNITKLRQTEAALTVSENKFSKVFALSPIAINILHKKNGVFADVNNAFCTMLGFTKEELIGKSLVDIGSISAIDYAEMRQKRERIKSLRDYPMKLKQRNGDVIHCLLFSETMQMNEEEFCINIFQNITQQVIAAETLKANKEQLQQIYNSVNDVIFLLEVEAPGRYRFSSVNQAFLKTTGLFYEDVVGKYVQDIIPEQSLQLVMQNYQRAIDDKTSMQWEEVSQYPTGLKTGIVSITPLFDSDGRCLQLVGSVHDITDQKNAREALNKSYEEIRSLATHLQKVREEERATIAREVHDELGQLLTGLKIELSWLKKIDKLPPEQINKRISSISTLLDSCINTVRAIATQLKPHMLHDLGLAEALRWQCTEFEQRTGVHTNFSTNEEEFSLPQEQAVAFFRILQESLTNIARHAQARTVWVRLTKSNDSLSLVIRDDGKGFMVEKVNASVSLGLLGMKERMVAIGGSFAIQSVPGEGTRIEITT
ncbi:MAG TPA: PAS domain S-box protein [Flavisolibacter sp.]|nr:PAS domain S-box protein [Flavisolibacter sp.]